MRIKTMRFGEVEIEERQVITFPLGLLGFPDEKTYFPIQHQEKVPLCFLQSLETPELTFVIADPFYFLGKGYIIDIPENDLDALGIISPEDIGVYVILTIREQGKRISANLAAPLVINMSGMIGRQVILDNSLYNSQFMLNCPAEPLTAGSAYRGK